MNKTEIIQWLVGQIFESESEFALTDVWVIVSEVIEYVKREPNKQKQFQTLWNVRGILKQVLHAES